MPAYIDKGTQFDHYAIMAPIGRGGMAEVWLARDERLNRTVAIKTIAPHLVQGNDGLKKFEREAHTIAQLEHPYILPIYDFGFMGDQLYIVMRYISGGTLTDRIVDGTLTTEKVLQHGRALALALDYAHKHGVIHLDIKPLNVLVDNNDVPYLADFGLAQQLNAEGLVKSEGATGALGYAAPEQMGLGDLSPATDIFGFGVTLYQMLTGELPFGKNQITAAHILSGKNIPAPNIIASSQVGDILRRAMAVQPTDRHTSAMELIEELEEALNHQDSPDSEAISLYADHLDSASLARADIKAIFDRAYNAWQQAKFFVLSSMDFILIEPFYRPGGDLAQTLTEQGEDLLLRSAIEYDDELDTWLQVVSDPQRLHAIGLNALRSNIASARARAVRLLSVLPDVMPSRTLDAVSHLLGSETDSQVRAEAIRLLELYGKPSDEWQHSAFTHEGIDKLLAMQALREDYPLLAESAARALGKLRSLVGIRHLISEESMGMLSFVYEGADFLPEDMNFELKIKVLLSLITRKLGHPDVRWRFLIASVGGAIGIGGYVFALYPRQEMLFLHQRMFTAVGVGVPTGFMFGMLALLTIEIPRRLGGLFKNRLSWLALWISSAFTAILPSVYYQVVVLNIPDPLLTMRAISGMVIAGAFLAGSRRRFPHWARVGLGMMGLSASTLVAYFLYEAGIWGQPFLHFQGSDPLQPWILSLWLGVSVSLTAHLIDIHGGIWAFSATLATFLTHMGMEIIFNLMPITYSGLSRAIITVLNQFLAFALGGFAVSTAPLSRRESMLAAVLGSAAYSLMNLVLFHPDYGGLDPFTRIFATLLYAITLLVGPLLSLTVAAKTRALQTPQKQKASP